MARTAILVFLCLALACSHPLHSKSGSDAAIAKSDTAAGADYDTEAPDDRATSLPAVVDAATEPTQPDLSLGADAREAAPVRDGPALEGGDTSALETSNSWSDAGWLIDGGCSDNPSNLMQVLATSIGSSFCARTASSQYEGYINFDSQGKLIAIGGWRVPADKDGWVESLAGYRWPCLAGQSIAYGCSLP